jgi:PIN domain nuclease of toxin-antitoxin system
VRRLPEIHRDPFDRMLVAQAIAEPLRLLTHDRILTGYSELVVAV